MDKQQKKSVIIILSAFAMVIAVLLLLIPVELKNMKYDKWGKLAEAAETDERAKYIIENEELYPDSILNVYYSNEENLDFVYNYVFHKDDYLNMSYTDEELNGEGVPALYMYDYRWGYESIGNSGILIKDSGCAYTCMTMAYLELTGSGDTDPVVLGNYAYENDMTDMLSGGLMIDNVGKLAEAVGLNGTYYNYDIDNGGTAIESADEISALFGEEQVIIAGMSGEIFGNHAIIIRECENGIIRINDPANDENTAKSWSFEEIKSEFKGIWVITRA